MIKREDYLQKLIQWENHDSVKIITGVRRSGKSVILKQFKEYLENKNHNIIYINFEDLSNEHLFNYASLHQYCLEKAQFDKKNYFLFDEIQIVADWEKTINSLRLDSNSQIYVSGSNANLLSSKLSTLLGGRYVSILVLPFSFAELRKANKQATLNEYLRFGGFPGVIQLALDNQKYTYLNDIINSIMFKDIMLRNKLEDPNLLKKISSFVYDNVGNLLSIRNISNTLKNAKTRTSQETIAKYIEFLKEAFLIYEVQRYDIKGREILTRNPKYYGIDMGFHSVLTTPSSKNLGSVLENVVYLELLRRGFNVYVGIMNNNEVDFVAMKDGEEVYIQVSLTALEEKTAEREFKSLLLIPNNFRKYLITTDTLDLSRDGIIHLNIEDFLLNEYSLMR